MVMYPIIDGLANSLVESSTRALIFNLIVHQHSVPRPWFGLLPPFLFIYQHSATRYVLSRMHRWPKFCQILDGGRRTASVAARKKERRTLCNVHTPRSRLWASSLLRSRWPVWPPLMDTQRAPAPAPAQAQAQAQAIRVRVSSRMRRRLRRRLRRRCLRRRRRLRRRCLRHCRRLRRRLRRPLPFRLLHLRCRQPRQAGSTFRQSHLTSLPRWIAL